MTASNVAADDEAIYLFHTRHPSAGMRSRLVGYTKNPASKYLRSQAKAKGDGK
jgi:hypothetical protein